MINTLLLLIISLSIMLISIGYTIGFHKGAYYVLNKFREK